MELFKKKCLKLKLPVGPTNIHEFAHIGFIAKFSFLLFQKHAII